jgi:hypothetical protein
MPCCEAIVRAQCGGKVMEGAAKSARLTLKRLTRSGAGQFENVLQDLMSPLFSPAVSHCWRCAAEPWVKLSGTA